MPLSNQTTAAVVRATGFWHQGYDRFRRRLRRMKFAVRSESFRMIWEGLAAEFGQTSKWQCSGIST